MQDGVHGIMKLVLNIVSVTIIESIEVIKCVIDLMDDGVLEGNYLHLWIHATVILIVESSHESV